MIAGRRRGSDAELDLGRTIEMRGLPTDVAEQLLIDAGVSSADVRRRLLAAGGGNPLVLVEAANLLEPAERRRHAVLPDPLPIGHSGQRMAELVLERLDPQLRNALVVVAADPDGDLTTDLGRPRGARAGAGRHRRGGGEGRRDRRRRPGHCSATR